MYWNWGVLVVVILPSLVAGAEIGLITAAASQERGWGKAWAATFMGLLTVVPIAVILYLIFTTVLPEVIEYVTGGIVFLLGLYFAIKGFSKWRKGERKESAKGISGGLLGSYAAVVVEGLEITTVVTALGAEAGNAYLSAWMGEAVGIGSVLASLAFVQPLLKRIPTWAFQLIAGTVMIAISVLFILFSRHD